MLDELVRTNDIDLVGLASSVNGVVKAKGQASIGQIVREEGAPQGLASVIGLMFLATAHADTREGDTEIVRWREDTLEGAGTDYVARVPSFFFLSEVPEP